MRILYFLFIFLSVCFNLQARTDLVVNAADPQYGLSMTTNQVVLLQAETIGQSGSLVLLNTKSYGTTDASGVCVFSNVFGSTLPGQGYYRVSFPYIQQSPVIQFDVWIQSSNLGTVNASSVINTWLGTSPAWTAATSDMRYAVSTNSYTNFVQIGQLISASNSIVALIPSTNGFVTAFITNGFATTNFAISVTNNFTSIVYSNPSAYATPQQVTNIVNLLANTNSFNLATVTNIAGGMYSNNPSSYLTPNATNALATTNFVSTLIANSTNNFATTNYVVSQIAGATNKLATTNALALYALSADFISGTNSVATVALAQIIATNNAIVSLINSSTNGLNFAIGASNSLSAGKQPASLILSNLAVNGAFTNILLSGLNTTTTTNVSGNTVFINATNQTFLTNGLASINFVTNQGYVTSAITNGLPGNSITNGFAYTNWVAQFYYPTSNPSAFVSASITNGFATTNYVQSSIAASNYATLGNVASTNTANLVITTNLIVAATNSLASTNYAVSLTTNLLAIATNNVWTNSLNYFYPSNNPSGFALMSSLVATNNALTNLFSIGTNNVWTNSLARFYPLSNPSNLVSSNEFILAITGTNAALLNTITNVAQNSTNGGNIVFTNNPQFVFALTNASQFLQTTGGLAQEFFGFGTKTNFLMSTNVIGIYGGGSGNGTYVSPFSSAPWTNLLYTNFVISLSGSTFLLTSNGVSLYTSSDVRTWSVATGAAPAPLGDYGSKWRMNGVELEGFISSTNLIFQATNAAAIYIAALQLNPTNGITAATATNITRYMLTNGASKFAGDAGGLTNISHVAPILPATSSDSFPLTSTGDGFIYQSVNPIGALAFSNSVNSNTISGKINAGQIDGTLGLNPAQSNILSSVQSNNPAGFYPDYIDQVSTNLLSPFNSPDWQDGTLNSISYKFGGEWYLNPGAVAGQAMTFIVAAPSTATNCTLTFSARMASGTGQLIYGFDNTGGSWIPQATTNLTTSYSTISITTDNGAIGGTAKPMVKFYFNTASTFVFSNVTVAVSPNTDSILSQPFLRYAVQPANVDNDAGIAAATQTKPNSPPWQNVGNEGSGSSSFVDFKTDAATLKMEFNAIGSGYLNTFPATVLVNGNFFTNIYFGGDGYPRVTSTNLALGNAGLYKTVRVINSFAGVGKPPTLQFRAVAFPATNHFDFLKKTSGERIAVIGDSISLGSFSDGDMSQNPWALVGRYFNAQVFNLSQGGQSLSNVWTIAENKKFITAALARINPTIIWNAHSANDITYGDTNYFAIASADLLDAEHELLPAAKIYQQNLLTNTAFGATLSAQYRQALIGVVTNTPRTNYVRYIDSKDWKVALQGDGIHPDNFGGAQQAWNIGQQLWTNRFVPSGFSVRALASLSSSGGGGAANALVTNSAASQEVLGPLNVRSNLAVLKTLTVSNATTSVETAGAVQNFLAAGVNKGYMDLTAGNLWFGSASGVANALLIDSFSATAHRIKSSQFSGSALELSFATVGMTNGTLNASNVVASGALTAGSASISAALAAGTASIAGGLTAGGSTVGGVNLTNGTLNAVGFGSVMLTNLSNFAINTFTFGLGQQLIQNTANGTGYPGPGSYPVLIVRNNESAGASAVTYVQEIRSDGKSLSHGIGNSGNSTMKNVAFVDTDLGTLRLSAATNVSIPQPLNAFSVIATNGFVSPSNSWTANFAAFTNSFGNAPGAFGNFINSNGAAQFKVQVTATNTYTITPQ